MPESLLTRSIATAKSAASRITAPLRFGPGRKGLAQQSAEYWTEHNVTAHQRFASAEDSLEYFHWRNAQYHNYIELMPVDQCDGKVVLDLGCGPGNDLVGFGTQSTPKKLLGADVSLTALQEARARICLHGIQADLAQLVPKSTLLPFETASIDYLHCSGVLHHLPDPSATLRECWRILRPAGEMRVMVYNRDSLWVHLYVAYVTQILERKYSDLDIDSAFTRTTDGPDCPISRTYSREAFTQMAQECGFTCEFLGNAISMWEMSLFSRRFDAVMDQGLAREHRNFILALQLDAKGYPLFQGHYAGIDACFSLRRC